MKNILYLFIITLLFSMQGATAQQLTKNNIRFKNFTVNKDKKLLIVEVDVVLDDLNLNTSDMIILTPVLRTNDVSHQLAIDPIVLTGKQRHITLKRAMDFENYTFKRTPQGIFRRYNNKEQTINMTINAEYEDWMETCDLFFVESLACCGLTTETVNEYKVLSPLFDKTPVKEIEEVFEENIDYKLSYIMPPAEKVKQRSETHTAQLTFKVGKDKIERDLDKNADILDEIDKIIKGIQDNNDLSKVEFKIVGYASPEGDHLKNMQLAQDRSKAFVYYLTEKYEIPASSIKTDWMGDDWAGLYKAVESSDISYKKQILSALETLDPKQRKAKLKQVAGGKAYNILLKDFFPQLRRNEYTISYIARNFNLEEAKTTLKKNPKHLSLNEMFLVANSYPKSSAEFKEVFITAAKIYPKDPVALQNAVAVDIENDNLDRAIEQLESVDTPEAYNNLGVVYAKLGDIDTALEYFEEAITHGNKEAAANKKMIEEEEEFDF